MAYQVSLPGIGGKPTKHLEKGTHMCHECDDEGIEPEEFSLDMIPEEEREEFVEFAQEQFRTVIEKASQHDILFELITEWPKAKQAMFTFTSVMENRLFDDGE